MPQIICPNCQHKFEPTDALRHEIQSDLRNQMNVWQQKKEQEYQVKEKQLAKQQSDAAEHLQTQLAKEKRILSEQLETHLRKQISGDYDVQLKMLQDEAATSAERLKESRAKELDFLKKAQELQNKEQELELTLQKTLHEERVRISETIRQEEAEKVRGKETEYQIKVKELEEKLESQRKLAEEMRRKAEQGSMQSQGEAGELVLEELLAHTFPYDAISEVAKGVRGADCIQTVRNKYGQDCGKIIFESKRTQAFSNEWIEKLKADMRSQGADVAILVTQAFPKDLDKFGQKDGIYICNFVDVKPLVTILREGIIKVFGAIASQENKGDKMHLLYSYLTSNEFGEQWRAIAEGFRSMRASVIKEREQMEKLWKAREKQLEKVLLNMAHFKGSIEGIAGQDFELNLLEDTHDTE